jgi:hypothetical protein
MPVGPVYEYPGIRASIVNAAKETSRQELHTQDRYQYSLPPLHVDIKCAATVHAFWSRELNV